MNLTLPRVSLVVGVLALVAGGALLGPSYAHDGDEPEDEPGYHERFTGDGAIIPEEPHPSNDTTVDDRAELRAFEQHVDPAGSPDIFVCADRGDKVITVVHEYPSDEADLKAVSKMGAVEPGTDKCAGKSMVVGK